MNLKAGTRGILEILENEQIYFRVSYVFQCTLSNFIPREFRMSRSLYSLPPLRIYSILTVWMCYCDTRTMVQDVSRFRTCRHEGATAENSHDRTISDSPVPLVETHSGSVARVLKAAIWSPSCSTPGKSAKHSIYCLPSILCSSLDRSQRLRL
jgi:hypothetical protein